MYVKHTSQTKTKQTKNNNNKNMFLLLQFRKTYIAFEDIFKHIQELQKSLYAQKTGECLLKDHKFWTELCTVLGVPNTSPNRYQLKRAYKDVNVKKVQTEQHGKEDAPESEGAQVKEVTQDMNDFQKENEKRKTKKKEKIIQDENDLKAEEGKKESEKQKEFGQMDVKKEDSKEVKTVLQEEDAPEIEGAKEEEVTQDLTIFQKEDEKEHMREKHLIKQKTVVTVDTAQEIKIDKQEKDVRDEMILLASKLLHFYYYLYHQYTVLEN